MTRKTLPLILALAVSMCVVAQEPREWGQTHDEVVFEDETIARMTTAITLDGKDPILSRTLYESHDSYLLVIYNESWGSIDEPDTLRQYLRIRSVASREELELVYENGQHTLTVEGASMSFGEDGAPDTAEVYRDASPGFVAALRDYVETTGSSKVLFPEATAMDGFYKKQLIGAIKNFDPNKHEPGEFERKFGRAYYERGR